MSYVHGKLMSNSPCFVQADLFPVQWRQLRVLGSDNSLRVTSAELEGSWTCQAHNGHWPRALGLPVVCGHGKVNALQAKKTCISLHLHF